VGGRGSGKTTLLDRFLYTGKVRRARRCAAQAARSGCPAGGCPSPMRPPPSSRPRRPQPPETPRPGQGLEYTYARRPSAYDHERRDLAHVWEVGGGEALAAALAAADNLLLTFRQVGG
jgi:hypothetical protein